MIKEYIVEVVLNPSNIQHYEDLCYSIQRIIDRDGNLRVKRGTKIKVFVFDLPKKSHVLITAICDKCGKERVLPYRAYTDICNDCQLHSEEHKLQKTGENNPAWNPNITDEERTERKENRTVSHFI